MPGYHTTAMLQNADVIMEDSANVTAAGAFSGGVALAIKSDSTTVLSTTQSDHFVAAALLDKQLGPYIVVGVYIPPNQSKHLSCGYSTVIDSIVECVATL